MLLIKIKHIPSDIKRIWKRYWFFQKLKKHYYASWDICDTIPEIMFDLFIDYYEPYVKDDIDEKIKCHKENPEEYGGPMINWVEAFEGMKTIYQNIHTLKANRKIIDDRTQELYGGKNGGNFVKSEKPDENGNYYLEFKSPKSPELVKAKSELHELDNNTEQLEIDTMILIAKYYKYMWD